GLTRVQDDLDLQEHTQPVHLVQVDARLAYQEETASLPHLAEHTQRLTEEITKVVGHLRAHDRVAGLLRPWPVGPVVVDQLASIRGEPAQLQAAVRGVEERVNLIQ